MKNKKYVVERQSHKSDGSKRLWYVVNTKTGNPLQDGMGDTVYFGSVEEAQQEADEQEAESMKNEKKEEVLFSTFDKMVAILASTIIVVMLIILALCIRDEGKAELVNDLCKKNQYDFCEVERWKLQDNFLK